MRNKIIYSVEDDESIRELLCCTMEASGFDVKLFEDAESMLSELSINPCDLILLDIMLPKMDGIEALKIVKENNPDIPVILVSAKGSEINKVRGLEAGADDYIAKPFGVLELIARIKARLRKSESRMLKVKEIEIDIKKRLVLQSGAEVKLTAKEFELLKMLMENLGDVVRRDDLLNKIWGIDFDGETRTLDMHIKSLRSKLGESGDLIVTYRSVGYKISANPSE